MERKDKLYRTFVAVALGIVVAALGLPLTIILIWYFVEEYVIKWIQ
jgi:uncharacterized membrane protein YqjE